MEVMSAREAADRWGISQRRVAVLCSENRIANAQMLGNMWLIPRNAEKPIDAMEHFPSLAHTNVSVALPVPNSDRWITCEEKKCNMNDYDINLIIFSVSEGQILRHRFKRVRRFYRKDRAGIFWLNIEANADLSWLRVYETDKTTRINTATGEMVPETDDLPPFVPVAYDYEKWKKLCKEPRLVPGLD